MIEQKIKKIRISKYIVIGVVLLAIFTISTITQFTNKSQVLTVESRVSRFVKNMTAIQFSKQRHEVFVNAEMAVRNTFLYGFLYDEENLEFWRIYSVEVIAYIDYSEFSEENIHIRDNTIRIDLPGAQIQNLDSLEFKLESEYLFNDFEIRSENIQTLNQNTEDIARSELIRTIDRQKIIETAQDQAKEWIAMLVMETMEYSREDISFNFVSAPSTQHTRLD